MTKRNCFKWRQTVGSVIVAMLFVGCASTAPTPTADDKLNNRLTRDEKINFLYTRAVANFEQGKQTLNPKLLESAKYELIFLVHEFKHEPSKAKLDEINAFYAETIASYKELVKAAKPKQDTLLLASYYKRALSLAPDFLEAKEFLKLNEQTIQRLLQENLGKGQAALKAREYARAQRFFTRVLNYDYESREAHEGLAEATKQRQLMTSIQKQEKPQVPSALASGQTIEPAEKEQLYQAAKAAFAAKDYLRARELFFAISDRKYKDTADYLQRTIEKIQALNLEDDR